MALLIECPKCKKRNSLKTTTCGCGMNIKKAAGKTYWIEYYFNSKRKRERIGPSKAAAEQRLRDVLKARAEERYINKDKAAQTTLGELCQWYLNLPEVKAKKSYRRDGEFIRHLLRIFGEKIKIKYLTAGKVETYQNRRLSEPSPRFPGKTIRPATINKEVTCLKTILNRAVRHDKLEFNPVKEVKKLPENNVRMRIISKEEVDLKKGFIRLAAERTKTSVGRSIPLHPQVKSMLEDLPRGLKTNRVFLRKGTPFSEIKTAFRSACNRADIKDFTFHDLRHCALNNLRLAGNDYFRIMAISGHKTMSVFKRYNLVTEEELSKVKWADENKNSGCIDTYMDTKEKGLQVKTCKPL